MIIHLFETNIKSALRMANGEATPCYDNLE